MWSSSVGYEMVMSKPRCTENPGAEFDHQDPYGRGESELIPKSCPPYVHHGMCMHTITHKHNTHIFTHATHIHTEKDSTHHIHTHNHTHRTHSHERERERIIHGHTQHKVNTIHTLIHITHHTHIFTHHSQVPRRKSCHNAHGTQSFQEDFLRRLR